MSVQNDRAEPTPEELQELRERKQEYLKQLQFLLKYFDKFMEILGDEIGHPLEFGELEKIVDEISRNPDSIYFNAIQRAAKICFAAEREDDPEDSGADHAAEGKENNAFYNMPTSPATDLIMQLFGARKDLASLPERKKAVSRNKSTLVINERGKARQVQLNSKNKTESQVIIELSDINKIAGNNKTAKKLFVLTLIKANEQAIHNRELTRNKITFPLQELVDIGFYSTLRSARAGFNRGRDVLTSLKIKGEIKKGKSKTISADVLEVLFTGAHIEESQCIIYLNERINWSFLTQYFTLLPRYYFALPNRSSDLLYYIFYLARQNAEKIQKTDYFTISFRAIQSRLNLPSEIDNADPQRTIKQPIEEAIEAIEDAHSKHFNNMNFALLPVYDDTAPIKQFLDNGYLKITLKEEFAQSFIEQSKQKEKKITDAEKRAQAITDRAKSIAMAKKIEAESNAKAE